MAENTEPRAQTAERQPLTASEEKLMNCLQTCIQGGYGVPAVRDLCRFLHYKSPSTVQALLDRLEKKGYIRRVIGQSRSIRILSEDGRDSDTAMDEADLTPGIPYLGPDGETLERGERAPYVSLLHNVPASALCAVRMPDDSMGRVYVFSGDTVIVARDMPIKTGDLVAARIEGKITIREYRKIRGGVQLKAYGQAGDSSWVSTPDLIGRVVCVLREFVR